MHVSISYNDTQSRQSLTISLLHLYDKLYFLLCDFLSSFLQPCKVRAFGIKDEPTTAFEIKFSDSVLSRDKTLDALK